MKLEFGSHQFIEEVSKCLNGNTRTTWQYDNISLNITNNARHWQRTPCNRPRWSAHVRRVAEPRPVVRHGLVLGLLPLREALGVFFFILASHPRVLAYPQSREHSIAARWLRWLSSSASSFTNINSILVTCVAHGSGGVLSNHECYSGGVIA